MRWGIFFIFLFFGLLGSGGWYWYHQQKPVSFLDPSGDAVASPSPKPLLRYSFESLSRQFFLPSEITFEPEQMDEKKVVPVEEEKSKRYLFSYRYEGKKISGLAQMPSEVNVPIVDDALGDPESRLPKAPVRDDKRYPVIIMLRGYVDKEIYRTGIGTERAGKILAENGLITLAPDFLGYGKSDPEPRDVWESRFSNPAQVLTLLATITNIPQADPTRVGLWAHSNGGQIALSVLEVLGMQCGKDESQGRLDGGPGSGLPSAPVRDDPPTLKLRRASTDCGIPTTLWAPVTKPFPYAILYFTDEFDDEGKSLRAEIARLEKDYDVRQYSITDYFDRIQAPLLLHQGTVDDAVPLKWSNQFVEKLRGIDKDITYYVYPGADHNLTGSWETVVERDLAFFKKELTNN